MQNCSPKSKNIQKLSKKVKLDKTFVKIPACNSPPGLIHPYLIEEGSKNWFTAYVRIFFLITVLWMQHFCEYIFLLWICLVVLSAYFEIN